MNTIPKKFAFIAFLSILFSTSSFASNGNNKIGNSNPAVLTVQKLTPRQFSKNYHAERKEYRTNKDQSTKKMNRRLKGPWFKRWFNKTF